MNSIFRKQFFLLTAGLVTSFILLTIGLIQAFSTYSYRQKEEDVLSQAGVIEQVYNWSYDNGKVNYELFQNSLYEYSIGFEYSFVVLNDDFNFEWSVKNDDNGIDVASIKQDVDFNSIFEGNNVVLHRKISDIIKNKPYVVGYPIKHNGSTVAAVLLSASMEQIKATTYDSYRIIVIFMCLAIVINFVIIYYSSNKFAVPLKQMSEAAKEIAGGDFEKRLNINTDDEIGDLATSFNAMAQSLFFQEKRRREFISNISHDLRSPLTSMRGFLQAILDGTIPPEKQDHYLQIVLDESERLAKMANDMLDINKLNDNQAGLNMRDFNLNELVDKTLRNFEDRALQNKIKISSVFCNEGVIVRADMDKIQRVIYNLVDNAIKFTHKYGYIKIITEIKDKKVYISVKDNGKGISTEEQMQVFDRLYKGDKSRGKDKKGSGLGLSIVKEFVRAHKEEITLKSEVGKGSTFTFTLPLVSKGEPIKQE
jgi:signal transduction histidine kinase